jgi:ABC-type transport system involved in multi-copper enzyme maturation permease subunit
MPVAPLFADIFDAVNLQLGDSVISWLTPVWVIGVGAILGLLFCLAFWGIGFLLGRIPALADLVEQPQPRWIAVGVLTFAYLAVAMGLFVPWGNAARGTPAIPPPAAAKDGGPAAVDRTAADLAGTIVSWAAASLLAALGSVALISRRTSSEVPLAVREGVLLPLFVVVCCLASFGVLGLTIVRKPSALLENLWAYPQLIARSTVPREYDIPAATNDFQEPKEVAIPVNIRKKELAQMILRGDQRMKIKTESFEIYSFAAETLNVAPDLEAVWKRNPDGTSPFAEEVVQEFFVRNYGTKPAKLEIIFSNTLPHPEMLSVVYTALAIAGVFLLYLAQRTFFPKLAAVAHSTAKSEIAQPLFVILCTLGIFGLILFDFVPYYTLGEDIKMLKGTSLNLILVLAIIQAIWAASTSVADEIEGKTALTVLSKPVSRRDFILGKFVGIAWTVAVMFVMFGAVMLVTVTYKTIYDARENSTDMAQVTWQVCHNEMMQTIPGLFLAYMETLVLTALSVAISTRLPMLANFMISFAIYVLGHLTPLLVQSQEIAENVPAPVVFLAKISATVLPVLDHFSTEASFATGLPVPTDYILWSLVYCALYSSVAMLLALTLFEDRDLA